MPPELRDVVHTRRLHCDFQVALVKVKVNVKVKVMVRGARSREKKTP